MNKEEKIETIMKQWDDCQRLMQSMVKKFNMIKVLHEDIIKDELNSQSTEETKNE